MNNGFKWLVVFLASVTIVSCAFASPSAEELISRLRAQQERIADMSADITTIVRSEGKEKQTMEQKGSIKVKGSDMVRIEVLSPVQQLSVMSKENIMVKDPVSGQKFVQKRPKEDQAASHSPFDQTRMLDQFELSVERRGIIRRSYVITGKPKTPSPLLGSIKFYVDAGKMVPTKLEVFDKDNKLVSASNMTYTRVKGIWVMNGNRSWVETPAGKMNIDMKFSNIKVNEGIPDEVFEIK